MILQQAAYEVIRPWFCEHILLTVYVRKLTKYANLFALIYLSPQWGCTCHRILDWGGAYYVPPRMVVQFSHH